MNRNTLVIPAKKCYDHLGGKLGTLLLNSFIEKGWIAATDTSDAHFYVTEKGVEAFTRMGVDLSRIKQETVGALA
ncbi:ArsR family transcriptional regulator [Sediminibacterium ginsengisoli]|uniref:ArsR family transcriptional regulator n=1 Tax=Sediminibacterium ginsengisoli TaxID=413434 RepID=A0A1T4K317_9BACT|nr:ArsR family transcriptional regulator [Sediminibacterium ginsengisoli]SJZ36743.1 hypothetical protein SAMN04488132_101416 [Sediminibacterium ginsengisoli]